MLYYCIYWISWSSYICVGTCELARKEFFFFRHLPLVPMKFTDKNRTRKLKKELQNYCHVCL